MQNGVSSVLGIIAKEVLSLEGGIVRLGKAFENLNRTSLVMGGGLAVLGGTTILYGLKRLHIKPRNFRASFMALKDIACHTVARMKTCGCLCLGLLAGRRPDRIKRVKHIPHYVHVQPSVRVPSFRPRAYRGHVRESVETKLARSGHAEG
jgi:hypothetical protein